MADVQSPQHLTGWIFFSRSLPNLRQTVLLSQQGRLEVFVVYFLGKPSAHQHLPCSSDLTAAPTACEREVPENLPRARGELRQYMVPPSNHSSSSRLILSPGLPHPGSRVRVSVAAWCLLLLGAWPFPLHTFSLRKEHLYMSSVRPQWSPIWKDENLFWNWFYFCSFKVFHWFNLFLNQPGTVMVLNNLSG